MNEPATKPTKKEPRQIKMDDGRTVGFPEGKRLQKETIKTEDGKLQVRIDFENGETRLFTLRPDMLADYALHGASQKLGDEVAGMKDKTIEDLVETIDQLVVRLDGGEWTKEREGGGFGGLSVLAQALVRHTKKPIEQVRKYLAGLDNKTKLALRAHRDIAPHVKAIEEERAAKAAAAGKGAIDVDAHLNALATFTGEAAPAAA